MDKVNRFNKVRALAKCAVMLMVLQLTTPCSGAGFNDIIRRLDFALSTGIGPDVTAPANPITYSTSYYSVLLHDKPIAEYDPLSIRFAIKLPILQNSSAAIGLQYIAQAIGSSTLGVNATSFGLFASTTIGPLEPSAYAAGTIYRRSLNHWINGLHYSATADPTLTLGLGLRLKLGNALSVQATYEKTAAAFIDKYVYKVYSTETKLSDDYASPVVYVHANSGIYVGGSYSFGYITSSQARAQQKAAKHTAFLAGVVDDRMPAQYRPFAEKLVESLSARWGADVFTTGKGGVYWDADKQMSIIRLRFSDSFVRNAANKSLGNLATELDALGISFLTTNFPQFDLVQDCSIEVLKYARELCLSGTYLAPPNVAIIIEFSTYDDHVSAKIKEIDPSTTTVVSINGPPPTYQPNLAVVRLHIGSTATEQGTAEVIYHQAVTKTLLEDSTGCWVQRSGL